MMTKDELFEHLLSAEELISYKCAHQLLLGPTTKWNPHLAQLTVSAASGGATAFVGNLEVTLDSLMVHDLDQRPGDSHYHDHTYGEQEWTTTFGLWALCSHLCAVAEDRSR
jgi:hypothetical protein